MIRMPVTVTLRSLRTPCVIQTDVQLREDAKKEKCSRAIVKGSRRRHLDTKS